jgi:hypothetical protein
VERSGPVGAHAFFGQSIESVRSVQVGQQPAKKAVRKSKKSWELTTPLWLKSAAGALAKKAERKSKKS